LEKEEKAALILVLLKQLQPYLSDVNLNVASDNGGVEKFLGKVSVQKQSVRESKEAKKINQLENFTILPCLLSSLLLAITNQKSDDTQIRNYQKEIRKGRYKKSVESNNKSLDKRYHSYK